MIKPVFRSAIGAVFVATMITACGSPPSKPGAPPPGAPLTGPLNQLLVGPKATLKTPTEIPFNGTIDLNYKTKEEVCNIRINMAKRSPGKDLCPNYMPSREVFDNIANEKAWVGLKGRIFHIGTVKPYDGQAEQSRFLCSPYILVGADWRPGFVDVPFDPSRYTPFTIAESQFPLQCPPKTVTLDAVNASEELTYLVTNYRNSVNNYLKIPVGLDKLDLYLNAYNARDFGYKWVGIPASKCEGINKVPRIPSAAFEVNQNIATATDMNSLKGDTPDFQRYQCSRLPAKLVVYLWKKQPTALENPDFTVTLKFE